ncbi:hypothetical protein GCM10010168_83080 [Actinoplanes ianthinogenes]|uniref:Uncharacterized protein n=1 Tax=Actinoplanes ianthinogenes TaxID=122358 RepID=A0ABM7M611_9ACTN|nr:DUF6461 domain-containing protein [Actinoplanes ianthinogenes]BCJ47087.1 hypothetical protein Aiant_77440 [Actinoplanes ianthinogenes]GGR51595.1 hypothetical protein GCM10010168_83080 [Actinoplanes ianthinogenes]
MDLERFAVHEDELGLDYCLAFARGLTAAQVAGRLGGTEIAWVRGLAQLPAGSPFVAVAELPGGAVIVEAFRGRLLFEPANRPLSQGTSVAVVYESEHHDPAFLWVEDGEVRVSFNPDSPGYREGSEPDALLDDMVRLGFDVTDEGDENADFDEQATLRAFALAEHVTGLPLAPGMLRDLTYLSLSLPGR